MGNEKRQQELIFKEQEQIRQDLISVMALNNLDVSGYDPVFLEKSRRKRVAATNCESADEYLSLLTRDRDECRKLLDELHISYSEFFRNPLTFSVLERIIIPSLFFQNQDIKRKEIRIWSAACAGGQEAYSVAMMLEEINSRRQETLKYRIFATDSSKRQVDNARQGMYTREELGKMTLKYMEQWFDKKGEMYVVKPELKQCIDFSVFNLLDKELSSPAASIFGGFDIVFCKNVLFYYKPECRNIILEKVISCIAKDGCLVVGEVERGFLDKNRFSEIYQQSGIFRVKLI